MPPVYSEGTYSAQPHGWDLVLTDGLLLYRQGWVEQPDDLVDELTANHLYKPFIDPFWQNVDPQEVEWRSIQWQRQQIRMFGRWVFEPRFTAWLGDAGKSYTYAGKTMQPAPWTPSLRIIKERLTDVFPATYNSVLLNWYRGGHDHMSWHADNERELGLHPTIASVSLGSARRFVLRRRVDPQSKIDMVLHPGSLLIMAGALQHHWLHAIPKQARSGPRMNLTFRKIL